MPIVVMMFTMQIGLVFMTGFDKVLLIYMPSTYEFSDCLSTYTYRMAFGSSNDFTAFRRRQAVPVGSGNDPDGRRKQAECDDDEDVDVLGRRREDEQKTEDTKRAW